jgi:hypothetical protein
VRDVVRQNFVKFNGPLEGVLGFMYTDAENLVTTAMGFLLPTPGSALELQPYWTVDGSPASDQQVLDSYAAVAAGGVNSSVNAGSIPGNIVRLTQQGIQYATDLRIDEDEPLLAKGFPAYDSWNAYAQMALWSMAWAMGPGFWSGFPQFTAAVNASPPRFADAAPPLALGHFKGVGIAQRIADNDKLWTYAQQVQDSGGDPDEFNWPDGPSSGLFGSLDATKIVVGLLALGGGAAALYPDRAMELARQAWRLASRWVG